MLFGENVRSLGGSTLCPLCRFPEQDSVGVIIVGRVNGSSHILAPLGGEYFVDYYLAQEQTAVGASFFVSPFLFRRASEKPSYECRVLNIIAAAMRKTNNNVCCFCASNDSMKFALVFQQTHFVLPVDGSRTVANARSVSLARTCQPGHGRSAFRVRRSRK